jgi:hydroxyacylglutathione hydrolase
MILERFYDEKLAQASYLAGCEATGHALVVDPNRDVEPYLERARRHGLRITHVTETHIHADFVSGTRELAARTDALVMLSGEGGKDWQYAFAEQDNARLLSDGDGFDVGKLHIDVMHTPGHTPEHLSFVLTDRATADRPMGIFTGDFVFVGDVGRPDLLERAAKMAGTMEAGAKQLYASVQRFRALPDYVQVWPGHGAGSACGKALGAVPQSTVGYEKLFSWAFNVEDEAAFVAEVLAGQPDPPRYFATMKRINREGPRVLGKMRQPPQGDAAQLASALRAGSMVVDTRAALQYAKGFIPGTINIPLNRSFTTWAGWLVSYDSPFYLLIKQGGEAALKEAVRDLALIGLDRVEGYFDDSVLASWSEPLGRIGSVDVPAAAEHADNGQALVLDVRNKDEWNSGHIPGALHIPLGELPARMAELPREREVIIHCQGGGRAAIGASVLAANGITNVKNLEAGFSAWASAGQPVETETGVRALAG